MPVEWLGRKAHWEFHAVLVLSVWTCSCCSEPDLRYSSDAVRVSRDGITKFY